MSGRWLPEDLKEGQSLDGLDRTKTPARFDASRIGARPGAFYRFRLWLGDRLLDLARWVLPF